MAYCTDIEKAKAFAAERHAGAVEKPVSPIRGIWNGWHPGFRITLPPRW